MDVNRFCKIFYDPNRDEENLHPVLDQVVDKFKSIDDDEHVEGLERGDTTLTPPEFDSTGVEEPEYDFLSEIINQVNTTYVVNLTEEDKLDLSRLSKKLIEDPEVEKYMNGNNTEDNKKNFFKEHFDGMMVDYVNDRFEFYKKMEDNPSMKNLIFNMMYKDFHKNRGVDT